MSLGVITLLFAMIFKLLPDVKIAWGDVWVGAFATALLFNLGKFLIGYYLGRGSMVSIYGAAGSFIILLLWVYYSAQILFFGAEFTRLHASKRSKLRHRFGTPDRPAPAKV
jgi:membrane protein